MNSCTSILGTSFRCVCGRRKAISLALLFRKCFVSSNSSFPLAQGSSASSSPALRNIAVPHRFSAKRKRKESLPPDIFKKKAEKALLHQLQQEVLWEGTVIDDPQHHIVTHFVELYRNPKYRNARRMMCVMGEKLIREICEQGRRPRHLLLPEGVERPQWALPADGKGGETEVVHVTSHISSSCFFGSDGFIGDFQIPDPPPKESLIANKQRMERVLVLDNVDDPGNLGTLLRTATGFHYDAIILTNHCADLFHQQVIRSARGAHFQKAVPIYGLQEEDGDDVDGMLNHIIMRNDLSPVLYAGKPDASHKKRSSGHALRSPSSIHNDHRLDTSIVCPLSFLAQSTQPTISLSEYCLRTFTKPQKQQPKGLMVFFSPNHKRNVQRRLSQRIAKPVTTLCVEYSSSDFLISSSTVLYALRPSGNWDYLPLSPSTTSEGEVVASPPHASVDIGANRLVIGEKDLSLDEAEQIESAHLVNEYKKYLRLKRKQKTDYDFWMDAEKSRISNEMNRYKRKLRFPWKPDLPQTQRESVPSWVPNIIDEYKQSPDRDYFRQAREDALKFNRPSNYDS